MSEEYPRNKQIKKYGLVSKYQGAFTIPMDELGEDQKVVLKNPRTTISLLQVSRLAGVDYKTARKYANQRTRLCATKRFPWQTGFKSVRYTERAVAILKELVNEGKRWSRNKGKRNLMKRDVRGDFEHEQKKYQSKRSVAMRKYWKERKAKEAEQKKYKMRSE